MSKAITFNQRKCKEAVEAQINRDIAWIKTKRGFSLCIDDLNGKLSITIYKTLTGNLKQRLTKSDCLEIIGDCLEIHLPGVNHLIK